MKLVTLNSFGGRRTDGIKEFLKKHSDVDVFCFQEVYDNAEGKDTIWQGINYNFLRDIKEALPEYEALYHPHLGDWWGLGMFIKRDIPILNSGEVFVHKEKGWNAELEKIGYTAKNLQYATLDTPAGPRTIINLHGLWNGKGKGDSEERLEQSKKIVEFLKTLTDPYILCGDFNLNPDTKSIEILESHGLRNLIKEFGINSTRTSLYKKENRYADYVLVSGGIETLDFSVLPDEVSDHSPLYLEFK